MEFKKILSKTILVPFLIIIFIIVAILWRSMEKKDVIETESNESLPVSQIEPMKSIEAAPAEDVEIQKQLDRDREEQKQTKYLKTRLEQSELELEQEKTQAQINKLKIENLGTFKEPSSEGQNGFPEIKIQYIGGSSVKKEAILSIAGTSFQVKEKSSPVDNVQVVAISDSSVTLHFSAPVELTKTFDYKPE